MRNATRLTVSTFGAIMALAGFEHGLGEVLQGNVAPQSVMIQSWPNSDFFKILAGEPAMTLIPNLLISGVLTILGSLICLIWTTRFIQRKHGGLILILLSIGLLLIGGGFGPPLLGLIIGPTGTKINAAFTGWRKHLPVRLCGLLAKAWPWLFAVCISAWLGLFPGVNLLDYFFGVNDANLTYLIILSAFGSLLLTILTGFARDSLQASRP